MDQGSMSTVIEHGVVDPKPTVKAVAYYKKLNSARTRSQTHTNHRYNILIFPGDTTRERQSLCVWLGVVCVCLRESVMYNRLTHQPL